MCLRERAATGLQRSHRIRVPAGRWAAGATRIIALNLRDVPGPPATSACGFLCHGVVLSAARGRRMVTARFTQTASVRELTESLDTRSACR